MCFSILFGTPKSGWAHAHSAHPPPTPLITPFIDFVSLSHENYSGGHEY
jgi:hypothetical protein